MTLEAGLTLTAVETVASNFLEEYGLTYSNAEYYTDFLTLTIRFEGPNNWTIGMEVDLEDIETVEELTKAIEHEYLREIEYISVDEYFNEMYDNVSREFTASEFLRMLEEDMEHFQSVVKKINGVEESIVTGDISTIIYNLEQMDFTVEEILMRLEDCLKGYTFELGTWNGDAITLKDDSLDKETTLLNKRDDLVFELATVVCELDNIKVNFNDMEQSQMFIDVEDYVAGYLEAIAREQREY